MVLCIQQCYCADELRQAAVADERVQNNFNTIMLPNYLQFRVVLFTFGLSSASDHNYGFQFLVLLSYYAN
jgi:hypothetical protein